MLAQLRACLDTRLQPQRGNQSQCLLEVGESGKRLARPSRCSRPGLPFLSPQRSLRSLASALLVLLFGVACAKEKSPPASVPPAQKHARPALLAPVLIFGVDGFEWSVALPLLAAGRMPNLAALMERSIVGKLTPLQPTLSPRLWTTIATGKLPHEHGILDFVKEPSSAGGKRLAYSSHDRQVKAFWNILSEWGLSSATLGWWMTYPAEPVLGFMLSQTNTNQKAPGVQKGGVVAGKAEQVWPPEEEAGVFAVLRETESQLLEHERAIFGNFFTELEGAAYGRWKQCEWAFRADNTYVRVLEQRLQHRPPEDVTALYLGGADVVGHRFWAAHEPAAAGLLPSAEEVRTFGHVIQAYYVWVDQALGRILRLYPTQTTVFVISDHGMTFDPRLRGKTLTAEELNGFTGHHVKREPGIFLASGPGIREASVAPSEGWSGATIPSVGAIFDFCPTLLALLGIPWGEDMHGRPLASVLDESSLGTRLSSSIQSHDDAAWLAARGLGQQVEEEAERIQQLENLGYLGGEDEGED